MSKKLLESVKNLVSGLRREFLHRNLGNIIITSQPVEMNLSTLPDSLENTGKLKIADIYGDRLIYRSLEPLEKKLPGLKKAGGKMQLRHEGIPRKDEEDYARASYWFFHQAQKLRNVSTPFKELLYIGDSLYSDGKY